MSITSSQQTFLINVLTTSNQKLKTRYLGYPKSVSCTCKYQSHDEPNSINTNTRKSGSNELAKLAIVTLAAGVLTLGSVGDASAAKTGGRVGGQAFRPSAPKSSGPRINNSRTNIYVNPPLAPPLVGGYGYGYGVPFYGGWGWSPFSFFAPGPGVAIGVGGGLDLLPLFLFLGVVAAVVRRFTRSRDEDDDY